ncbi:MAG: hypothetical protein Q8941_18215 [Bacteroidota bacterium]|nr:hypothetical protein [Bacteroidota bacterium]
MRFTLLQIDLTATMFVIYLVGALLGWSIFYYTIKAAVKNGIKEARYETEVSKAMGRPEKKPTAEQEKLQQLYDKGQITFDEYQTTWAKLDKSS